MTLSIFSTFRVQKVNGSEPKWNLGFAGMVAALVESGEGAPISILPNEDTQGPRNAHPSGTTADDWSLWFYDRGRWSWGVIGALVLDDIVIDIVHRFENPDFRVEEIRICPPGTVQPKAVS